MFTRRIVLACVLLFDCVYAKAAGPQIWLAGVDPVVWPSVHTDTSPDYMELFQPGAQWDKAAQAVGVFKTSMQFLTNASDDTLSLMFADLKRRNIALGMEALMLTASPKCGAGIEGYSSSQAIEMVVSRVRQLGGDLRYVAMDEPLDVGHFSHLPNACRSSLADLASDVAIKVRAIRRIFPGVLIGDIEGFSHPALQDDIDAMMAWTSAYEHAVGTRLSFLHVDVLWSGPWQAQIKQLTARLHAAGIKLGIVYNGNLDDQTGRAWTRHAEQRFVAVEANPILIPDQAILQTWMQQPDHMLPETQPGTMTWLVNRYLTGQTRLVMRRDDIRLLGELKDEANQPLADAAVTISAELEGKLDEPILPARSGRVPPRAVAAVMGLRINAECNCSGPADIAIGTVRYQNDSTGQTEQQAFGAPLAPGALARFQVPSGHPISQNTQHFPVTGNDLFTIQVPMQTNLASASSGYVALIFLDAKGKEIERLRIPFKPAERSIGIPVTDAQGRFSLLPNFGSLPASVIGFHADFMGDAKHRTASATLQ